MADLKNYEPALMTEVTAGGKVVATLGAGITPALVTGSGVPTVVAPKGSLYLRTDGSGVADRLYVASDAVGGWTAVSTAS